MFDRFKEFYDIFGVDNGDSVAQKRRTLEWVRTRKSRLRKQVAWHDLFGKMSLEDVVFEINSVWIDPAYELVLGIERVKKVRTVVKKKK